MFWGEWGYPKTKDKRVMNRLLVIVCAILGFGSPGMAEEGSAEPAAFSAPHVAKWLKAQDQERLAQTSVDGQVIAYLAEQDAGKKAEIVRVELEPLLMPVSVNLHPSPEKTRQLHAILEKLPEANLAEIHDFLVAERLKEIFEKLQKPAGS